jgi:hypothetical protein
MKTKFRKGAAGLAAAAILAAVVPVRAAGDEAAGVALFDEAKKLLKAGDYAGACPKIQEAQRLFPTPAKLLALGDCFERTKKLASAWGAFKQAEIAARNAGDRDREAEGMRRAAALEGALSKLTIVMAGVPGTGIEVRRDGGLVGEGQLGTPVPVDAGEHVVEVTAPKRQKWTTKVQVAPGGVTVAVSIPELPLAEEAPEPSGAGTSSPLGPRRIAGVVLGGAGLASVVAGAIVGARALSLNSDSKTNCSPSDPNFCNTTGVSTRSGAITNANVSTALFAAGGALAVTGVVLVAVPSSSDKQGARVEMTPGLGGFTVKGRF